MGYLGAEQIIGAILFFVGTGILTLCNRYERGIDEKLKDPKVRWAVIDGNKNTLARQKSRWGTLMTLAGVSSAIYGAVLFLSNLK